MSTASKIANPIVRRFAESKNPTNFSWNDVVEVVDCIEDTIMFTNVESESGKRVIECWDTITRSLGDRNRMDIQDAIIDLYKVELGQ
jgi:hypothetical protein